MTAALIALGYVTLLAWMLDFSPRRFRWYRRWRGGRWAPTTGLMWGTDWVRLPPEHYKTEGEEAW